MATKRPKAKWTKENIRKMLETSDEAVIRGLLRIHSYQTAEEQAVGVTKEDNGMGFNGTDAWFLSEMVVAYNHYKRLTPGQMAATRKAMLKYSGQLARHANAQELAKEET